MLAEDLIEIGGLDNVVVAGYPEEGPQAATLRLMVPIWKRLRMSTPKSETSRNQGQKPDQDKDAGPCDKDAGENERDGGNRFKLEIRAHSKRSLTTERTEHIEKGREFKF